MRHLTCFGVGVLVSMMPCPVIILHLHGWQQGGWEFVQSLPGDLVQPLPREREKTFEDGWYLLIMSNTQEGVNAKLAMEKRKG